MKLPFKTIFILLVVAGLSIGLSYVSAAWSEPTATAPSNNIDVPINQTSNDQVKNGSLSVGTFAALGNAILDRQAYFGGPIKGIEPGSTDPTLRIGGISTQNTRVVVDTIVNGTINSGKTLGSSELINPNLNTLCADADGHIVFCTEPVIVGGGGGGSGPLTFASCFVADTQITLADGSKKSIQDVQIGDVLKGDTTNNTVLAFHRPELGEDMLYSFNRGPYFVTAEHPFMTTDGWKSLNPSKTMQEHIGILVTKLRVGDTLVTENGLEVLTTLDSKTDAPDTMLYNFVLDGDHTYIADGYVVHNKTACSVDGVSRPQCGGTLTCLNSATSMPLTSTNGTGVCSLSCIPNQPVVGGQGSCPTGTSLSCSASGEQVCQ